MEITNGELVFISISCTFVKQYSNCGKSLKSSRVDLAYDLTVHVIFDERIQAYNVELAGHGYMEMSGILFAAMKRFHRR